MISVNVDISEASEEGDNEPGVVAISFMDDEHDGEEIQVAFVNEGIANVQRLQFLLANAHGALPGIIAQMAAQSE